MESDRREPPPDGGIDDEGEPTCRYVMSYDAAEPLADDESWLLEWCLAWVDDPDVIRVDVDRADGPAPDRVIVHLGAEPDGCRQSPVRRRLVDRLEERVDAFSVTCHPIPDGESDSPASEPAQREGVRPMEVFG